MHAGTKRFFFINITAVLFTSTVSVYKMNVLPTLLVDTEPTFVADIVILQIYNVGTTLDFDAETTLAYHRLSNVRFNSI